MSATFAGVTASSTPIANVMGGKCKKKLGTTAAAAGGKKKKGGSSGGSASLAKRRMANLPSLLPIQREEEGGGGGDGGIGGSGVEGEDKEQSVKTGPRTAAVTQLAQPPMMAAAVSMNEQKYDRGLLVQVFGEPRLLNVTINEKYDRNRGLHNIVPNYWFQYLKTNLIFPLNQGNEVDCYQSVNGALAIFNFTQHDEAVVNNSALFLMEKARVNRQSYLFKEWNHHDTSTKFIRSDKLTSFWDKEAKLISTLPQIAFKAKIALKIMGLMFLRATSKR
jgi:hypothetical protein